MVRLNVYRKECGDGACDVDTVVLSQSMLVVQAIGLLMDMLHMCIRAIRLRLILSANASTLPFL